MSTFKNLHFLYSKSPKLIRAIAPLIARMLRLFFYVFPPRLILADGIKVELSPADNATFRYLRHGIRYEQYAINFLVDVCRRNPASTFFDVGAGYGIFSLRLACEMKQNEAFRIHAFEPDPRCFRALSASIANNDFTEIVIANQVIVGDVVGEALVLISKFASTSNRAFQSIGSSFEAIEEIPRPALTLDNYVRDNGLVPEVLVMKIDVNGNEPRVFDGARQMLRRAKGYCIMFEFYPIGTKELGLHRNDFKRVISDLAPDQIFFETDDALLPINGIDDLFRHMDTCPDSPGRTGIGISRNYIISKGMA